MLHLAVFLHYLQFWNDFTETTRGTWIWQHPVSRGMQLAVINQLTEVVLADLKC